MPSSRIVYDRMHSGLVAEAIASGLPFVIPGTPALLEQSSGAGRIAHSGDGAETAANAVETLLQHFKPLAALAYHQAGTTPRTTVQDNWADWLLDLAVEAGVRRNG